MWFTCLSFYRFIPGKVGRKPPAHSSVQVNGGDNLPPSKKPKVCSSSFDADNANDDDNNDADDNNDDDDNDADDRSSPLKLEAGSDVDAVENVVCEVDVNLFNNVDVKNDDDTNDDAAAAMPFRCDLCPAVMLTKWSMRRHCLQLHELVKFFCPTGSRSLSFKPSLLYSRIDLSRVIVVAF